MANKLPIEEELAAAKKELAAAKQIIEEKDQANKDLQKEFDDFKAQAIEEIKAAQENAITIISDKVVEIDGKKYEFTQKTFGVIGEKGKFNVNDIVKEPAKYSALLSKLVKIKSSIIKELVAPAADETTEGK